MNEAVTKRFLLYFRLMLLVWILIANAIIHVTGLEYSWLIFLSNIMMFTLEGDVKDRFVTVELGGLVGLILTVIALLSITTPAPSRSAKIDIWLCRSHCLKLEQRVHPHHTSPQKNQVGKRPTGSIKTLWAADLVVASAPQACSAVVAIAEEAQARTARIDLSAGRLHRLELKQCTHF